MEVSIRLPKYAFESSMGSLVAALFEGDAADSIALDFGEAQYYIPAGITTVLARLQAWKDAGKSINYGNLEKCPAAKYFQRMDFFTSLGIHLAEDFNRHNSAGDFVPVRKIGGSEHQDLAVIIRELVETIPGSGSNEDVRRLVQYALGEIINNCVQHSNGTGFVSAQYASKHDFLRIGISDNGMGIRESFRQNGSVFYNPSIGDKEHLVLALQPEVSSKNHIRVPYGQPDQPVNQGIGLTMVSELCKDTLGHFVLSSGNAMLWQDGRKPYRAWTLLKPWAYSGTICSLAFRRAEIHNYGKMIHDSKVRAGLLKQAVTDSGAVFT